HVLEEPGVDLGEREDLFERESAAKRVAEKPEPARVRQPELLLEVGARHLLAALGLEAVAVDLERADRLLQRLLERPADRHRLADRLHLRAEQIFRLAELLEREARDLGDDVVDRRLERRRRLARDVVRDLVERVTDRELRG